MIKNALNSLVHHMIQTIIVDKIECVDNVQIVHMQVDRLIVEFIMLKSYISLKGEGVVNATNCAVGLQYSNGLVSHQAIRD